MAIRWWRHRKKDLSVPQETVGDPDLPAVEDESFCCSEWPVDFKLWKLSMCLLVRVIPALDLHLIPDMWRNTPKLWVVITSTRVTACPRYCIGNFPPSVSVSCNLWLLGCFFTFQHRSAHQWFSSISWYFFKPDCQAHWGIERMNSSVHTWNHVPNVYNTDTILKRAVLVSTSLNSCEFFWWKRICKASLGMS